MSKATIKRKIFAIILSVIIFVSPILFSGCSLFDSIKTSKDNPINFDYHPGGGGGSSGGNQEQEIADPPAENELHYDDYYDYFKNYRVTYKPGETDREGFNQSIIDQNQSVSQSILEKLFEQYGNSNKELFTEKITNITIENNQYIAYQNQDDDYFIVSHGNDAYVKIFNHNNVINGDNNSEVKKWNFSTDGEVVNQNDFNSDIYKRKIQLASALILSGNYIDSEDSEKNTFNNLYAPYKDAETIDDSVIDEYISQVNHLGWTDVEIKQLASYVLNYVIGEDLVAEDNNRFVNAYCDVNGDLKIVYYGADNNLKNSKYNRFLTDETYATGMFYNGSFVLNVVDEYGESENGNLEGLLYYAGEYLKTASLTNVNVADKFKTTAISGLLSEFGVDDLYDDTTVFANEDVGVSNQEFGNAIYQKLIKTDYRNNFNANVWQYDSYGNMENATDAEKNSAIYRVGGYTYSLFSVRLPYFKNYYNTVNFMVRDLLDGEASEQTKQKWFEDYGFEYPYAEEYPTIPYTYFVDLDSKAMEIDEETFEITMKGVNQQAFQSFMIMPEKDLYLKDALMFFHGPNASANFSQNFNIKVYARYFDSETQTYATWGSGEEDSEFYSLGEVEIEVDDGGVNGVTMLDEINIKEILCSAKINGMQKGNYLLSAFSNETEVLTEESQQLVTKENYGYWFNYVSTPEGQNVVCFDGKNAQSSSYLEFVFYNESNTPFEFTFIPNTCYKA